MIDYLVGFIAGAVLTALILSWVYGLWVMPVVVIVVVPTGVLVIVLRWLLRGRR